MIETRYSTGRVHAIVNTMTKLAIKQRIIIEFHKKIPKSNNYCHFQKLDSEYVSYNVLRWTLFGTMDD